MSKDHPIAFLISADQKMIFSLPEHTAVQFLALDRLNEHLDAHIDRISCPPETVYTFSGDPAPCGLRPREEGVSDPASPSLRMVK